MQFDARDIRIAMDVYTADDVYLGSVLSVPVVSPRIFGREDAVIGLAIRSSEVSGESLGPAPTEALGNSGPSVQSTDRAYATEPDEARIFTSGTLEVGKWWGLVGRKRIPLDYVQAVSMDNVKLRLTDGEIG